MAYIQRFIRLSWGGTLGPDEIWANNMHIISGFGAPDFLDELFDDDARLDAIRQLIVSLHSSTAGSVGEVNLEWVKFAMINTDGKYIGEAKTYYFAGVPGGYSSPESVGAFTSAAVSFKSVIARGPSANGRIYPPANSQ